MRPLVSNSPGSSPPPTALRFEAQPFARRFWYWWWIVPRVQYDLGDLDYQLYTFEVFHKDWRSKLVHYVTIPAITFFSMAFLAQFQVAAAPLINGGLAYLAALAVLHIGWCRRNAVMNLWVVLVAALVGMWLLATAWIDWAGTGGPWYAPTNPGLNPLLWVYVFALLETLSHGFEPIPPFASGGRRFVELPTFVTTGGLYRLAAILGVPTAYTFVSFASNLHLFPTFILRMLASAGYERDYVRSFERIAAREWADGQPRIDQVPERERPADRSP